MKRLAIFLLLLFFIVLAYRFLQSVRLSDFKMYIANPFEKKVIVGPLPKHDPALDLANLLHEKGIAVSGLPIASDSALIVQLADATTSAWFSANKDLALQATSLQIIINKLTIEGRKAKKIDFRFKEPVVVY